MMRVGGLATGMDIESIVNKLMEAERIPLTRMKQDQTMLTWKRDAFREINRALLELDEMMLDMKLSKTYQSKTVHSSQENAVTAIGSQNAINGAYQINVQELASHAINVSHDKVAIDPNTKLGEIEGIEIPSEFSFKTFDVEANEMKEHKYVISENDTLNDILLRITADDNNVRAFYDKEAQKVVLETIRTGKYNESGKEIEFDSSNLFFTDVLKLDVDNEKGGTNAKFIYNNGLEIESKNNWYELNGVVYEFKNVTDGNARLTVSNDVDHTFDTIVKFVNKYNEIIEKLNSTQQEEIHRDFRPLTDEQKKDMSENEIKLWEEKAKSGILRRESAITDGMFSMRRSWYANVETSGEYTSLTQIGITTSNKYLDGGKLEIDEDKLREAIRNNPEDVQKLFSNSSDSNSRGLVNRLEDSVKMTMRKIEERAGKDYHTLENYVIGKQMDYLNKRISDFEKRMVRIETRYWNQFTQMEKAIQRMNEQSAQLFSQFSGM